MTGQPSGRLLGRPEGDDRGLGSGSDPSLSEIRRLRDARIVAEADAARRRDVLLAEAEAADDAIVRLAAAEVRAQRAILRRSGDVLGRTLLEVIERIVGGAAGGLGFTEDADALVLLAIDGRAGLEDRHLALVRAERVLERLRRPDGSSDGALGGATEDEPGP